MRVEAAAHRGHPVWFELVWPWTKPERMDSGAWPTAKVMRQVVFLLVVLLLLGAAIFMARRNLVLGRGDRRGAFRISLLLCGLGLLSWAFGAHNVAGLERAGRPGHAGRRADACWRRASSGSSTSPSSPTRAACVPGRSSRGRAF